MSTRNAAGRLEGRYDGIGPSVSFEKDGLPDPPDVTPHDLYDEPPSEGSVPRHTEFLDLTNGEGGGRNDGFSPENVDEDAPAHESARAGDSGSLRRIPRIDPSTPGKVVESGQEHTGRWTREEHEAFLTALQLYGKEWKKVAAKVKTRTVVQTRTHAQKYFQKLQKVMSGSDAKGEVTHVEMGVAAEAKKASSQKKKRQPRQQSNASTHAAAHLMTNLSSVPTHSSTPSRTSVSFPSTTPSGVHFPTPHGFSTPSSGVLSHEQSFRQPRSMASASFQSGFASSSSGADGWKAMKIKAPDPDHAFQRGKFPEPSPAACGKRKVAEIAAARMLAGVMSSGSGSGNAVVAAPTRLGDVTPPPQGEVAEAFSSATLKDSFGSGEKGKSLSLQILNPDSLGFDPGASKRRRGLDGEASPTTPWDGQLEALVSEDKSSKTKTDETDAENGDKQQSETMGQLPDEFPSPVVGPGSGFGRSALHRAVCERNVANVKQCVTAEAHNDASKVISQCDEAGFYPIHSASALRMIQSDETAAAAAEITQILLSVGADAACTDGEGNTPLHWAARAGDDDVAHALVMKNCLLDAQNKFGETPLHWAMRAGRTGMRVVSLLLRNGARTAIFNKQFKRPLDVAADGFGEEKKTQISGMSRVSSTGSLTRAQEKGRRQQKSEQKRLLAAKIEEKRETRANFLLLSDKSRTLVLYHPECQEHIPKSESDWEVPDRVNAIMRRIQPPEDSTETTGIFGHEVTISTDFDRANLGLLSRVHSTDYLKFVDDLSKELELKRKQALTEGSEESDDVSETNSNAAAGVPFTPMVQRSMMKIDVVKKDDHSDTSFSAGSLRAARRAAGAVQHAVDRVLVGRNRNAFCVVRPPGHHAGVEGLLAGGESCGFCIFNNVAAGAMHAISDERLICERCAIVDIDVHHGNGTEEIVKKYYDPGRLFFFSIHLYDNEKKKGKGPPLYKFYPGTGDEDNVAHNIINVPITPLWKERESSPKGPNAPRNHHNTRRKAKEKAAAAAASAQPPPPPPPFMDNDAPATTPPPPPFGDDSVGGYESSDAGITASPHDSLKASDTESEARSASYRSSSGGGLTPSASPRPLSGSGRLAYRRAIQHRLIPALRAFNPDLILISAGFDAAKGDVGNAKHMFGAKEKMGIDLSPADYGWATRKILEVADICCQGRVVTCLEGGYGITPVHPNPEVQGLDKNLFSECAVRHLQAMIDPYDAEARFSS